MVIEHYEQTMLMEMPMMFVFMNHHDEHIAIFIITKQSKTTSINIFEVL